MSPRFIACLAGALLSLCIAVSRGQSHPGVADLSTQAQAAFGDVLMMAEGGRLPAHAADPIVIAMMPSTTDRHGPRWRKSA
jgi:hypothetical protein